MKKYKIISHIDRESGHFKGYSLAYKPYPFIPYWKTLDVHGKNKLYGELERIEHDICFLLRVNGIIKDTSKVE